MRTFQQLMLSLPCTKCGAAAKQRCHTKSGRLTEHLHAARFYAAKDYEQRMKNQMGASGE